MSSATRRYFDNAATSFPKPDEVHAAMTHYATQLGASPGRGAYAEAREAGEMLLECRRRVCRLIGADVARPEHVIFTLNTSDALNLGIRGVLEPLIQGQTGKRPHVITTWLDHNSVLRPYNMLAAHGRIEQTRVPCDPQTGLVDPDDIAAAIRPETALIACVHGSNVTGTMQPIAAIGRLAREHNIPFLVDAAQTLGHVPIDVVADHIDLLAFPGHKGLLGPLGTGGLYIRPGIEDRMWTVREGGTGSVSEDDTQPTFLPDRFEPGSHNAIGIIGLGAGVQWILDYADGGGVAALWQEEQRLIQRMLDRLLDADAMPGLTLYGPQTLEHRCGVFSVRIDAEELRQPAVLSDLLEREHGILTRSGVHCAPLAHRTFGTHEAGGMTRLSLGPFLGEDDVDAACDALSAICQSHARAAV